MYSAFSLRSPFSFASATSAAILGSWFFSMSSASAFFSSSFAAVTMSALEDSCFVSASWNLKSGTLLRIPFLNCALYEGSRLATSLTIVYMRLIVSVEPASMYSSITFLTSSPTFLAKRSVEAALIVFLFSVVFTWFSISLKHVEMMLTRVTSCFSSGIAASLNHSSLRHSSMKYVTAFLFVR